MGYGEAVSASAPLLWWRLDQSAVNTTGSYLTDEFHRYWRIYVHSGSSTTNISAAELALSFRFGSGNLLNSTSSMNASSVYTNNTASYGYQLAVDSNLSTFWASNTGAPVWIGVDFGSGVSASIQAFTWTARNDGFYLQAPLSCTVQYSDDNSNWTNYWVMIETTAWTQGAQRTYTSIGAANLYIWNSGVNGASMTGIFAVASSSVFSLYQGPGNLTNPAYNPYTGLSGAIYSAGTAAGYAIVTPRVHDLDFMNPFDPANYGKGWTVEWWMKTTKFAATSASHVWSWNGFDSGYPESIGVTMTSIGSAHPARNISWYTGYRSGSDLNFAYGFSSPFWALQYSINDQEWYHCALVVVNQSATTGAPGISGGPGAAGQLSATVGDGNMQFWINGQGGWPQTSAGTWATISGNAGNSYFQRNYAGGIRFLVGTNYNTTYGYYNGQGVYIQDVAVYDRVLGPEEIFSHWLATRKMIAATGTLFSEAPIQSVQLAMRDINVPSTGTTGAADPRATKTNPGAN